VSQGARASWVAEPEVDTVAQRVGAWFRQQLARRLTRGALDLRVEGLEHVPVSGPAILVARHYHHLYDALAILASVPREVHVVVALDWLGNGTALRVMRWLASAARWPGVWRARSQTWRVNRSGYQLSLRLLRQGRVLLIFPEAYPTIDPGGGRKTGPHDFLPFDPGFLVLAERTGRSVPIVPVGLWYGTRAANGWAMTLRFGAPVGHGGGQRRSRPSQLAAIEADVRRLSRPPTV
jgi:1-acyl-sn-glycerol-3-phosphate acyltransferase